MVGFGFQNGSQTQPKINLILTWLKKHFTVESADEEKEGVGNEDVDDVYSDEDEESPETEIQENGENENGEDVVDDDKDDYDSNYHCGHNNDDEGELKDNGFVNFHSIESKASRCIGGMGLVENMIEPPKKKRDTSDENLSHLYYDHDN